MSHCCVHIVTALYGCLCYKYYYICHVYVYDQYTWITIAVLQSLGHNYVSTWAA